MLLSFLCETIKWMSCNRIHSGNGSSVKTLEAQSNNNVFKFLKHEVVACYKFLKCATLWRFKKHAVHGDCALWVGVGVCAHENKIVWWMSITFGYQAFFWNCKLPPIFCSKVLKNWKTIYLDMSTFGVSVNSKCGHSSFCNFINIPLPLNYSKCE